MKDIIKNVMRVEQKSPGIKVIQFSNISFKLLAAKDTMFEDVALFLCVK